MPKKQSPKRQPKTAFRKPQNRKQAVIEAVRLKKILGTPSIKRLLGEKRFNEFVNSTLNPVIEKYRQKSLEQKDIEAFNKKAAFFMAFAQSDVIMEAHSKAKTIQSMLEKMSELFEQDKMLKRKLENWLKWVREFRETTREEMTFDKARTMLAIKQRIEEILREKKVFIKAKETRRDRLIRMVNAKIIQKKHVWPEFPFRKGEKDFIGRKRLVELSVKTAIELGSKPKTKSDTAAYLADVLTIPQLTGTGIGYISQKAVGGEKGVAQCLRQLQEHGIDIGRVVIMLLTEKPKSTMQVFQGMGVRFGKREEEIVRRALGRIFYLHQQRLKGHKAQQRYMSWLREKWEKIYGTKLEHAMISREDVRRLRGQGVPEEAIMEILTGIIKKPNPKPFKPKTKGKIIRRPPE